ncbi:MAG: ATP-binding cassette domain-containing protein, partial [Pseudomonadota bacterium]
MTTSAGSIWGRRWTLLEVEGLNAWYGPAQALRGVSFAVAAREVVVLLGRNGAGKSTTLKSLAGLMPRIDGAARVAGGASVGARPPHNSPNGPARVLSVGDFTAPGGPRHTP